MADNGFSADEESSFELPASMFHTGDNPEDFAPLRLATEPEPRTQNRPAKFTEIDGHGRLRR